MTGNDLKAWRLEHRYSQRALSLATGVSWATISNYERGATSVPLQFRLALAALSAGLKPVGENKT